MKKVFVYTGFCILLMLIIQCRPSVERPVTIESDTTVAISTLQCLTDTTQTYVIALPDGFNSKAHYPVVFVFDPHGDGSLAVKTLLAGASDFGYIIAGSNMIRNGYDNIDYALQVLTRDVTSRYPVASNRMYAAGFSGGGRVAQIFSQLNREIQAVVSIGAGYSLANTERLINRPSMLFIAGNEDFNYLEIMNAGNALSASGIHYYMLEYTGKHAWPDRDIIRQAFEWFELDAFRKSPEPELKSRIRSYKAAVWQQVMLLEENHDVSGAVVSLEKGITFLSGISHTQDMQRKLESLKKSPEYLQVAKQKQDALTLEMRLRQGYAAALTEKDTIWWRNEMVALDERISSQRNTQLQPVYTRIKNFISMAAYSNCNRALSQHDLSEAEKLVAIYHVADPSNPDVYYFKSLLLSEKGQENEAILYYRKAVELGFSDFQKAKQELPVAIYSVVSAK